MRENILCNASALGYDRPFFEICETLCDICLWDWVTLLRRGLALKHCFVLKYRVILRLYECSELYLEIPEIIMMILLDFLKQDAEKTGNACLNVQIVAVIWMNFLLTSAWRNLISSLQFIFRFMVDIIASWGCKCFNSPMLRDVGYCFSADLWECVWGVIIALVCLVPLRDLCDRGQLVSEGFCGCAWPRS